MLTIFTIPYIYSNKLNSNVNFRGAKKLNAISTDLFVKNSNNTGENFSKRIRELLPPNIESKTIELLFTPKFKVKERYNEEGLPITTIIKRSTGRPKKVSIEHSNVDTKEIFNIYDVQTNKLIGFRSFKVDDEAKQINPGYMYSGDRHIYAGMGIRGHQLAVEMAMNFDIDVINIEAIPKTINFHKKCLYTDIENIEFSPKEFDEYIEEMSNFLMLNKKDIIKLLPYTQNGDSILLHQKQMFEEHPEITDRVIHLMELKGECLELWKDMAKTQPILLS